MPESENADQTEYIGDYKLYLTDGPRFGIILT